MQNHGLSNEIRAKEYAPYIGYSRRIRVRCLYIIVGAMSTMIKMADIPVIEATWHLFPSKLSVSEAILCEHFTGLGRLTWS
jgi:hypothetical protein